MKNKNFHYLSIILSFVLILLTSGCYTILNHPRVETEPSQANNYYSCSDCHGNQSETFYYPPVAYPGMWDNYYIEPWWYNEVTDPEDSNVPTRSIIGNRNVIIRDRRLNSNTINIDTGSPEAGEDTGSTRIKIKDETKVIEKKKEKRTSRTTTRPDKKTRNATKERNNPDSRKNSKSDTDRNDDKKRSADSKRL